MSEAPPPAGGFGAQAVPGAEPAFGPVIPASPHEPSATYAKWTFVVGVVSLIGIVLCFLSIPFGIGAIAMGVHSVKRANKHPDLFTGNGYAIAGLVLGILSLLTTAAMLAFFYFFAR